MAESGTGEVLLEVDGGVAIVTLNAPDRRNALTPAMADELIATFDEVDGRPDVGALVIRAVGLSANTKHDAYAVWLSTPGVTVPFGAFVSSSWMPPLTSMNPTRESGPTSAPTADSPDICSCSE